MGPLGADETECDAGFSTTTITADGDGDFLRIVHLGLQSTRRGI